MVFASLPNVLWDAPDLKDQSGVLSCNEMFQEWEMCFFFMIRVCCFSATRRARIVGPSRGRAGGFLSMIEMPV